MSENDTSIDTFKRWTVPVLQQYLRKRGLRTSGKKEELVALVYSADLMKIKPVLTPAEERKLKADQYCDKLKAPKEGLESAHHPFTAPHPDDVELVKTHPELDIMASWDEKSLSIVEQMKRRQPEELDNKFCVISFSQESHKQHRRITRPSVEGRLRIKKMDEADSW
ncbi:DARS2 [Mytilus edulis]|uniref:DARS2 n=1 Tax=Mytilus edulis TaxID=6550 RepID=A0A8S3R1A2_MYTED|nr:DARS2 [Mytilus edulis]